MFQQVIRGTEGWGYHGEAVAGGFSGLEKPLPGLDLITFALLRSGPVLVRSDPVQTLSVYLQELQYFQYRIF